MKIISLSDGTKIQFPEVGDHDAGKCNQRNLDFTESWITGIKFPIHGLIANLDSLESIDIPFCGEVPATVEFQTPADLFSRPKTFNGIMVRPAPSDYQFDYSRATQLEKVVIPHLTEIYPKLTGDSFED